MINLMYIVLTAMLALNVSADVLDGFTQVEDGLNRSNENVARRNQAFLTGLRILPRKILKRAHSGSLRPGKSVNSPPNSTGRSTP